MSDGTEAAAAATAAVFYIFATTADPGPVYPLLLASPSPRRLFDVFWSSRLVIGNPIFSPAQTAYDEGVPEKSVVSRNCAPGESVVNMR